jgi:hypothetical protein
MFVFVVVASAALTAYLVYQIRHINALLLFVLILGGVIVGTVVACLKSSHLQRELSDLIRKLTRTKTGTEED